MNKTIYYILRYKTNPDSYYPNDWFSFPFGSVEQAKRFTSIDQIRKTHLLDCHFTDFDIIEMTIEERIIDLNKVATEKMEDNSI